MTAPNSVSPGKRRLLQQLGSAAAMATFPPSIQRALAIPAHHRTGTLRDVEHVVILMQENRSFDHYFGTLPGVRGFGDRFPIPVAGGRSVWEQSNGARIVLPYHLDRDRGNALRTAGTPHDYPDAQAAWDAGRMAAWPQHKRDHSMGYYQVAELEFQFALANAFTLCDAYHCAAHGGTNINRLFLWTGTNDPAAQGGGPATRNQWDALGPSTAGWSWTTYPERLQQAGISWKVYQNLPDNFTDNPLAGFQQFRRANELCGNQPDGAPYPPWSAAYDAAYPLYKGVANTMADGGLLQALRKDIARGSLPQVSWIVAPAAWSEHPDPSSPTQGAWYTQEILNALTAYPEVWSRTVLFVTFDENDGFFDHVPPPAAPSLDADGALAGGSTVDTRAERHAVASLHDGADGCVYGPGPRVPMYVISPWSRGGWVNSQAFDHTSVLRFLEARFGVRETQISPWRRAVLGDLTSAFDFATPDRAPLPPLPVLSRFLAQSMDERQQALPPIAVPDLHGQRAPVQAAGTRPSRALPYELHVQAHAEPVGRAMRLVFSNTGAAAAVFHVYDCLHLDRVPRRYTVEPARHLEGNWDAGAQDDGRYDLWVLGPNGFHRRFCGGLGQHAHMPPEVTLRLEPSEQRIVLTMLNPGERTCIFTVVANAYYSAGRHWQFRAEAGASVEQAFTLSHSGCWYDFSALIEHDETFLRRYAGRMETGLPSISDPAMGQG